MDPRARLTNAQFAVLDALWKGGPQKIRQLTEKLYPSLTTSEYATIQKLLEQLEEKGCVRRDRSTAAHVFYPTVDQGDLIDAQLEEMAGKLGDGSLSRVLMHLVTGAKLSASERNQLRQLLADSDSTNKPQRKRKP